MELITNFLSSLVKASPGTDFNYYYVMAVLIAVLFLGSFAFKQLLKHKIKQGDFVFKHIFKKVSGKMVYFSIGFLFLTLVRYENIPYFSMRLWMYLLLLGLAFTVVFYGYKFIKVYPKELANFKARPVGKKEEAYTPHKRKK